MSFISIGFFIFFVLLLFVLYFVKDNKKQNIVLLVASYAFYAIGDVKFLVLTDYKRHPKWQYVCKPFVYNLLYIYSTKYHKLIINL